MLPWRSNNHNAFVELVIVSKAFLHTSLDSLITVIQRNRWGKLGGIFFPFLPHRSFKALSHYQHLYFFMGSYLFPIGYSELEPCIWCSIFCQLSTCVTPPDPLCSFLGTWLTESGWHRCSFRQRPATDGCPEKGLTWNSPSPFLFSSLAPQSSCQFQELLISF